MRKRKIIVMLFDIVYEDRTNEIVSFTKKELASFKMTNQFKKRVTMKKVAEMSFEIKFANTKQKL